jgi:hypothetical protein
LSSRPGPAEKRTERLGSLDKALEAASVYIEQAVKVVRRQGSVLRADTADAITVGELFQEWSVGRATEMGGFDSRLVPD